MEVHRYTKNDAGGHKVPLGGRMRNRLRLATPGKGKDTGTVNMDKKKKPFHRVPGLKSRKPQSKIPGNKTSEDIIKVSQCDLSALREELERVVVPQIPAGVRDIDADVTDPFKEPTYAEDIMRHLRTQERKFGLPTNHLDGKEVTPHMRRVLVDWLIQVQEHQRLEQETLHLAITFLDHFLHRHKIPTNKLQLAGVVCILIAAKYTERFAPEIDELIHLTDNAYNRRQVLRMERGILRTLDFELYMPEPSVFLDRFLQIEDDRRNEKVVHLAWYILDLSLLDAAFVPHSASMKAAAALALARDLHEGDVSGKPVIWSPTMTYYTGYNSASLRSLMGRLAQALVGAPTSKQAGATTKYGSQSRHLAVAKWMAASELPNAVMLAYQAPDPQRRLH